MSKTPKQRGRFHVYLPDMGLIWVLEGDIDVGKPG